MSDAPWRIVGTPRFGGILIVADHASNRVPEDVDLGIAPELLEQHIAVDIGVAGVAERMAAQPGIAAFLANVSRLVCDFNREGHEPAAIPIASDGHAIPETTSATTRARPGWRASTTSTTPRSLRSSTRRRRR